MKRVLILNKNQVQQKINRMAYQILEDNIDENEIIIAGVIDRGHRLALRLKIILEQISSIKITVACLNTNELNNMLGSLDIPLCYCDNKVVILVDDVLNSGRTFAYGLRVFLSIPLKKLRSAVLIDRSHKLFPISTDFTGLELSTVLKEHVEVILDEPHQEDSVYLT